MPPTASRTAGAAVTIVLADDHHVVRSGLRLLLAGEADFDVVAEAADADAAVREVVDRRPAVLVLDLGMPGAVTSPAAVGRVRERAPATAVVIVTMQEDRSFARCAVRRAASGG